MLQTFLKTRKKVNAAHLLAVLFLIFIFYVGVAAFPEFLYHCGNGLHWETGYQHYIDTVDTQYEGMLSTEKDQPLLHNKASYINLGGLMAHLLQQPSMNERVLLKNGHLAFLPSDAPAQEEIQSAADAISRLSSMQTAEGKHFLFVMVPSQISKYEDLLPVGYTDTSNDTADTLLSMLEDSGVTCLDLREKLQEEGLRTTDVFYKTDHHWLPQTGFWAYTKLLDKLVEIGAVEPVDPFYTDIENYSFQICEDTFLGSGGKRTGIYYAGIDDSSLLRPEFETDIAVTIEEFDLSIRGPYEEVCYNKYLAPNFADPDYFMDNIYGLYGWGDTQLTQWRNEQAPQQQKLLLIGDSFGNVPFSLLSICFSSCDEMDTRHYVGDFSSYYDSYSPDTVVLLVNVDYAISPITTYPYTAD